VAKYFCEKAEVAKFHRYFISCNESPHGTHSWCRKCEKCAFVYLILSAFLAPPRVQDIFDGFNMLMEPDLSHIFLSLVGGGVSGGKKPYDCIGTFAESSAAVELSVSQWRLHVYKLSGEAVKHGDGELPVILQQMAVFIGILCSTPDANITSNHHSSSSSNSSSIVAGSGTATTIPPTVTTITTSCGEAAGLGELIDAESVIKKWTRVDSDDVLQQT
jgi:hypothetical protein